MGVSRLLGRHRLAGGTAIAGAAATLVMGAVVALTSDTLTSHANHVQTGTYDSPTNHTLQYAIAYTGQSCAAAVYMHADPTALYQSTAPIGWTGTVTQPGTLCLKNTGGSTGKVTITAFANVQDYEVGAACEASETAAGDTTCGPAAGQGELQRPARGQHRAPDRLR